MTSVVAGQPLGRHDDHPAEPIPATRAEWGRAIRGYVSASMAGTLRTLADYMDADGTNGFPGQKALAADLLMSTKTVGRHLREAERLGWITQVCRVGKLSDGRRSAVVYRLTIPADVVASPHLVDGAVDDGLRPDTGVPSANDVDRTPMSPDRTPVSRQQDTGVPPPGHRPEKQRAAPGPGFDLDIARAKCENGASCPACTQIVGQRTPPYSWRGFELAHDRIAATRPQQARCIGSSDNPTGAVARRRAIDACGECDEQGFRFPNASGDMPAEPICRHMGAAAVA